MAAHEHHRRFGTFDEEYFPGVSPAILRPGAEPLGFEGNILPAGIVALTDWFDADIDQDKQRAAAQEAVREAATEDALRQQHIEWEKSFTFGAVKKPLRETLSGYKHALKYGVSNNEDIQFAPDIYGIFDGIIVGKSAEDSSGQSLSPAFNPNHPHYEDYAPLRRNIAILRNYLLVRMFPDAEFKPHEKSPAGAEDARNYMKVQQMAEKLGKALAGHRPGLFRRFLISSKRLALGEDLSNPYSNDFLEAANIPDRGIEVMYKHLFDIQSRPALWDAIPFMQTPRTWGLLPLAQTPFSMQNMLLFSRASRIQGIAAEFDRIVLELRSVDDLSPETKQISVEYAREILEKLKLLFGNSKEENHLSFTSDPHEDESWMLLRAARAFKDTVADIAKIDVNVLKDNDMLKETINVLEQINYRVKVEAMAAFTKEGRKGAAQNAANHIRKMPDSAKTTTPLSELTQKLKTGLNEACKIKQEALTKAAQLQGTNINVKNAARKTGTSVGDIKAAINNSTITSNARITQASKQAAAAIRQKQDQMIHDAQVEEARRQKLPQGPGNTTIRR